MPDQAREVSRESELRARALSRLAMRGASGSPYVSRSEALAVLYEMASSPERAADALALLHELQVHQVELDLQDEELRDSVDSLDTALRRQTQLYDFSPVASCTIDTNLVLYEINRTGVQLIGYEREALLGRALSTFLTSQSVHALRAMLADGANGAACTTRALSAITADGSIARVLASAARDPAGDHFLIALMPMADSKAD